MIPDVTRQQWAVNIRKYVVRANHLNDLVALGSLTLHAAAFLDAAVAVGLNVLVAGSTQAGKTTMLNALAGSIPARDRIVTCEEVFELRIMHRDVVALQCRQPSLEGTGEIPLRRLVKEALRMRPSRFLGLVITGSETAADTAEARRAQRSPATVAPWGHPSEWASAAHPRSQFWEHPVGSST